MIISVHSVHEQHGYENETKDLIVFINYKIIIHMVTTGTTELQVARHPHPNPIVRNTHAAIGCIAFYIENIQVYFIWHKLKIGCIAFYIENIQVYFIWHKLKPIPYSSFAFELQCPI